MQDETTPDPGLGAAEVAATNTADASELDDDTLELIYDEIRLALDSLREQKRSLDAKASILVGFAGTMAALLARVIDDVLAMPYPNRSLVLVGIVLLMMSVFLAGSAYWLRAVRIDPNPAGLEKYLGSPLTKVRLQVMSNRIDGCKENRRKNQIAATLLRLSFLAQAIAILCLGASLLITVL